MSIPPPIPVGLSYATVEPQPPMRAGFRVIGVLAILAGGVMLLSGVISVVIGVLWAAGVIPFRLPQGVDGVPSATPVGQIGSGVLSLAMGVGGVWTGVALWRGRRWTQAVLLGMSQGLLWLAVAFALAGAAGYWQMAGAIRSSAQDSGAVMPPGMMIGMMIGGVFAVGIYVGVPAVLVWVMSRPGAVETVQMMDRRPSWVDGRPVAMVAAVTGFGLLAVFGGAASLMGILKAALAGGAAMWVGAMWALVTSLLAAWVTRTAWRAHDAVGGERTWRAACVYAGVTMVASVLFATLFRGVLAAQAAVWGGVKIDERMLMGPGMSAATQGWACVVLVAALVWYRPRLRGFATTAVV